MVLVHGPGTHVNEALEPRQRAGPVERRHGTHHVDLDDAAGVFRLRLPLRLECCTAGQRRHRGAVYDVGHLGTIECVAPTVGPGDIGDNDGQPRGDRREVP